MAFKITLVIFAAFISTISGQKVECQTSSTKGGNAGGQACVFPFIYNGKSYTECTTINNGNTLWCSTTANYDKDNFYGECICSVVNSNSPAPSPGAGCVEATVNGAMCSPSFNYDGNKYSGCPTVDNSGTPWCSLTKDYDKDKKWANCASPLKCETPQTGTGCREKTIFGATCASSFIYNKVTYSGCTTVGNGGVPWCSTTDNYDKDGQYGNCAVPLQCVASGGAGPGCLEKTYFGSDCAPTFVYNSKNYSGCTTTENKGTPWCSLTDNFDRDNQWARCATPLQCAAQPSGGGCIERTKSGGYCAETYIYNMKTYVGCTKVDYGNIPWCSLTDNYDVDKQYEQCETPLKCTSSTTP